MSLWTPVDLLPGLYAGLLAWLVAAALRRWYDPVPGWVLAALAVALLPVLGPVLFGGKVLLPLDTLRGHVPFTALPPTQPHGNLLQGDLVELVTPSLMAGREAWLTGCWPLWNAQVGAGMPLLADPQAQALQPLALAGLPLTAARAAGVIAAMRLWTALLFTFLLLSAQGLGNGPALAGAFSFGLGGFLMLWLGWPLANTAALLPVVLYAIVRCDLHGGRRDRLLLAAAAACLLLGGHPETVIYASGFSLAFLLDRWRRSPGYPGSPGFPRSPEFPGSPGFLRSPGFPGLPRSPGFPRRPGRPAGERRALLRTTLPALLLGACLAAPALLPTAAYLPQSLRAARLNSAPPPAPAAPVPAAPGSDLISAPPRPAGSFLGELARRWLPVAVPNAFGNSRFLYYWGASNTNEDASGFTGTATLLAALLALSARRRLPQEGLALACAGLCLVVLAAPWRGLTGMAAAMLDSRRLLLLLAFCLAYLAACTWERFRRGEVKRLPVLIAAAALAALIVWGYLGHADPTAPGRLALLRMGWLRWQLRFLVGAALLAAATPRRWRQPATFLAAALVAAELLLAHLPANPPAPRSLAFPPSASLGFLFDHRAEGRMAALGRALPPNLASAYHLADARLYNPMAPAAYLAYIAPVIASWWGELPQLGFPASPLYFRLGVRYLLTAPGERLPPPWELAFADDAAWVYRRPRTQAVFSLVASGDLAPVPGQVPGQGPAREQTLDLVRFDAAWFAFRAPRIAPATELVSSLYQDGGWRLLVDGRRQRVASVDGPFLAAPVPAGKHRLDLLYRPGAFLIGCALAAGAAAALCAASVAPPRRHPPAGRASPAIRDGSTIAA